jgi:glycerate 2-kinase
MMKILIAPDSMKDCLPAEEVAKNIEIGIRQVLPDADIKIIPMADGGEGTTRTLIAATKGKLIEAYAHDPLMRPVKVCFGMLGDGATAVVEVAAASGLELLKKEERNPWLTTSYGSGELIKSALDHGCRKILVGLGGSATNDAGTGIIQALGGKFLDHQGKEIEKGGGALSELSEIDLSGMDMRLTQSSILVACDVKILLCGESGTSIVYGAQKGADDEMRIRLDNNLRHFANIVRERFNLDISDMEGAGAAGGIGGGLKVLLKAVLKPGFSIVAGLTDLEEEIKKADMVITGEGRTDLQTLSGKVPYGVAQLGKKHQVPVFIISGSLLPGSEKLFHEGASKMISLRQANMSVEYSISNAPHLLQKAASELMNDFLNKKA